MRIVDEHGNEITDPDLDNGYLEEYRIIKAGVDPIDNDKKFAYDDDDWEDVLLYVSFPIADKIEREIADLKHKLAETDYIGAKIIDSITGCTSISGILKELSAFNVKYADKLKDREAWRSRINELENERNE